MAAESRRWKASAIVAVVVAAMAAAIVEGNYSIAMGGRRAIIDHIKGDNAAVRAGLCQVRDEIIQESAPWRKWTMLKIHNGLSFQHSASATCGNPDLVPGKSQGSKELEMGKDILVVSSMGLLYIWIIGYGKENSTIPEPTNGACDKLEGKAKDKSYEVANAERQPQ